MGWSEFKRVRNDYNDTFKSIDENLLKLICERKTLSKGRHHFPPMELMEEWAVLYNLDVSQISWLIHSLNDGDIHLW